MWILLTLTLIPSFVRAETPHLYGAGFKDQSTGVILSLQCFDLNDQTSNSCETVKWRVDVPEQGSFILGAGYSLPKSETDEWGAMLKFAVPQNKPSMYDLQPYEPERYDFERDEFAQRCLRLYINGVARDARENHEVEEPGDSNGYRSRFFGLYKSINRTYIGNVDVSASFFAKKKSKREKLASISYKKGWNWSERVKSIKHQEFASILRAISFRALKDEQADQVWGSDTLGNYLNHLSAFQNGQTVAQVLAWANAYGRPVAASASSHKQNGVKIKRNGTQVYRGNGFKIKTSGKITVGENGSVSVQYDLPDQN